MRRFTRLFFDLDATTSTGEKLACLESYFRDAPPEDACWGLAMLTGNRPKGAASTGVLRAACLERTGHPEWLLAECHAAVGDLSETIALLLPEPNKDTDEPLHVTMAERVLPLRGSEDGEKARIIGGAWDEFGSRERLVYHKMIRGGFRVGVQKRLVTRALASVAGIDPEVMAHRLVGRFEPTPGAFRALMGAETPEDQAQRPYPFFLAHPLEGEAQALGDAADWVAEWKWDGIRAQLIRRGGETALWSRGEEPIAAQFPEIVSAGAGLPDGTVIDGEVLLWRGGGPLPFSELQTRLNRKVAPTHQPGLFDDTRAVLVTYDLLEWEGADLRGQAFETRRANLRVVVAQIGSDTLLISEPVKGDSWETWAAARGRARSHGAEGLMLKHRASVYGIGRTRSADAPGWLKWKVDPYTLDAVLVGAQPGSGRRASLYTDYTFAVWDREPEDGDAELITFAKAYSGLDQDEIERLDRWIRSNTTARRGPFRQVRPQQVFEIAFEGLRASDRHRSGIAVRFPRILRWRTDKPASEADTVRTLRGLLGAHRG
jgi:DNA ligase-1